MTLTVLIAPSGFKESLSATDVADAIAEGVAKAMPSARILKAPIADGGEGFTAALVAATRGTLHPVTVRGPLGTPVDASFGFLGGTEQKTTVLEIAAAAGLRLVPREARDPTRTTSYGVGELIRAALDAGAQRIIVGCGDSGVNDGGAGMAQALGVKLLDAAGHAIGFGGIELKRLAVIDPSGRDPRLAHVKIAAAVNWDNVLLGPRGVARVFGPQKGASPEQVLQLEQALTVYERCIFEASGLRVGMLPGSGASGGIGAGLHALVGVTLRPRYELIMRYLDFDALLAQADLVVTAEGQLDGQTPFGKVPAEVARRAKAHGLPVVALAAAIGEGSADTLAHGIDAFTSIQEMPCSLDESMDGAYALLCRAAEGMMRSVGVGLALAKATRDRKTGDDGDFRGVLVTSRFPQISSPRDARLSGFQQAPAVHRVASGRA